MTLILAMLLDAWAGEPRWLWSRAPHPAVLMGRLIGWADARFNSVAARRLKGVAVMVALGLGALQFAFAGAIALAFDHRDVGVVGEPIEKRGDAGGVGKDLVPLLESPVGGYDD